MVCALRRRARLGYPYSPVNGEGRTPWQLRI